MEREHLDYEQRGGELEALRVVVLFTYDHEISFPGRLYSSSRNHLVVVLFTYDHEISCRLFPSEVRQSRGAIMTLKPSGR